MKAVAAFPVATVPLQGDLFYSTPKTEPRNVYQQIETTPYWRTLNFREKNQPGCEVGVLL